MQYNLVFSTDINYLSYLFVTCQSIVDALEQRDTNAQDELVFNVITDETVQIEQASSMVANFKERNHDCDLSLNFKFHLISPSDFSDLPPIIRDEKTSLSTYYRIIFDRFLPEEVQYAVYLDIDMLVLADIRKLFEQYPLHNKVLGAVSDPGICGSNPESNFVTLMYKGSTSKSVQIPKETYFNAGLLLFNLTEWRKQNLATVCLETAQHFNLTYHDQDLLNYVCLGKVELLDLSWNFQSTMFYVLYNPESKKYDITSAFNPDKHWACILPSADRFEQFLDSPNIVHFLDAKPWQVRKNTNFITFAGMVQICPKLLQHKQHWINIARNLDDSIIDHFANADAASDLEIKLNKLENKTNILYKKHIKYRKISVWGLCFLLLLNFLTLILVLCK